jgi:Xaa-Pro dipeptidase
MRKQLRERIDRIFDSCKGVDRIFLQNTSNKDPNFVYLTNFKSGVFEYTTLTLERKGITIYANVLEYETALRQKFEGMRIINTSDREVALALLRGVLKGRKVGINARFLTYAQYGGLKKTFKPKRIVDVSNAFSKARLVKNAEEIGNIRAAAKITKRAMEKIRVKLSAGMTEVDAARKFDDISEELGSEGPSFDTIVCFGNNSAFPHHKPDNTKLKAGDLVLIDAGATVNNYCSDMTRTFIFGGRKGIRGYERKIEMLSAVKEAQRRAISMIRPGIIGKKVDKVARDYLDSVAGGRYKGKFMHALGHSIGIEVHDDTTLDPRSKLKLLRGVVSSVEPGLYVPGFGGVRIEDDIIVTKDSCEIL